MFHSDIHKLMAHAPTHVRELAMFKEQVSHMVAQINHHKQDKED